MLLILQRNEAESRSFCACGNDFAPVRMIGEVFSLSPLAGDKVWEAGGDAGTGRDRVYRFRADAGSCDAEVNGRFADAGEVGDKTRTIRDKMSITGDRVGIIRSDAGTDGDKECSSGTDARE